MTMSCKIPDEVQNYIRLVELGPHRCCKEQHGLVEHIKKTFETEDIYVDEEQLRHYLSLAKYFPFHKLFPWQEFVVALWDCTYWKETGRPRWKTVFALVGLINFINLVMTNIIIRRHEFATMQSIGMTNRQLRKMMISESFSYVLLAGIVGTLAAAVLGITLVRSFVEISPSSIMMTFQMTLLPALVMLILFLALAFIVPVVALRLFNSRSVVERLRVNE
mgnify:CR=1 FL=1